MGKRTWSALKSCKQKRKAKVDHHNDRLSSLPDEIQLQILSHLTMKDAARASLVSHKWKQLWPLNPSLNFEDRNAILRLSRNFEELILQERSAFIGQVDYILEHHLGSIIDEFRVAFDLNHEHQSIVDKWLAFAFAKQVKRLELVLKSAEFFRKRRPYDLKMPVEYHLSCNFGTFKPALTSLCLDSVNVTAQVVECFLGFFPSLEILCIRWINSLTSITACSSLPLKHLEVRSCQSLDTIDLFVPHLLSFSYQGQPAAFHFRNASSLSAVSIGSFHFNHLIAYAFDFLFIYSAQLVYLELKSNLSKLDLEINQCPVFTNLKHLALNVVPKLDGTLLGWTPLIKACPVLQKLTLKLDTPEVSKYIRKRKYRKHDAQPLNCLKTLEIIGLMGHNVDLELAMYVLENAPMLDEVIVDARNPHFSIEIDRRPNLRSQKRALKLLNMLPRNAKLIFK